MVTPPLAVKHSDIYEVNTGERNRVNPLLVWPRVKSLSPDKKDCIQPVSVLVRPFPFIQDTHGVVIPKAPR